MNKTLVSLMALKATMTKRNVMLFFQSHQQTITIVSHLPGGQLPPPIFFFFFWRIFLGFFDLQLMEDIKDGKEEVLDEVVMEHIK